MKVELLAVSKLHDAGSGYLFKTVGVGGERFFRVGGGVRF